MTILFTLYERHRATSGLAVVTVFLSTTVTELYNVPPSDFFLIALLIASIY
jgi:hypothetical protein